MRDKQLANQSEIKTNKHEAHVNTFKQHHLLSFLTAAVVGRFKQELIYGAYFNFSVMSHSEFVKVIRIKPAI